MPPIVKLVWRICSSDKNHCDLADAQKQRASRQQRRCGAVLCLFYGTAKWAGHERLICSDKLRKNKHGKSLKNDDTPCALESQPCRNCRLRRRANSILNSHSCPAKMGSFHSLLRQANFQNTEHYKLSNNTAAPCILDSLKLRVEDARTDFVSVLWSS